MVPDPIADLLFELLFELLLDGDPGDVVGGMFGAACWRRAPGEPCDCAELSDGRTPLFEPD